MSSVVDPYLDDGMRGWIVQTARKNLYKVVGYDLDDLIQEGYFCFYKCKRRYVGKCDIGGSGRASLWRYLPEHNPTLDNKRHFMALVKIAFCNHIVSLSRKNPLEQTDEAALEGVPIVSDLDEIRTALIKAPKEIKQLVNFLLHDALAASECRRVEGRRETTDQKLTRVLGLDMPIAVRKVLADICVGHSENGVSIADALL